MSAEIAPHLERLAAADAIWYASVRPNGRPHLAPIWHVWVDDAVWVCTDTTTVRSKNLATSEAVSVSIADTASPVIIDGIATVADEVPEAVNDAFKSKYDWDIVDYKNRCLIRIEPEKLMTWIVGSDAATRWRRKDGAWHPA